MPPGPLLHMSLLTPALAAVVGSYPSSPLEVVWEELQLARFSSRGSVG